MSGAKITPFSVSNNASRNQSTQKFTNSKANWAQYTKMQENSAKHNRTERLLTPFPQKI